MKTWQGRFDSPSDRLFESFTSSVAQDRILAPFDVQASRAHAKALAAAGVISEAEREALVAALDSIANDLRSEKLEWADELEDVHTHVEVWLRERVGELAGKLHAGRSRNDQVATDLRLYVNEATGSILERILDLQHSILELAGRCGDDLMPGYTHLQQAQPVLIAYALLAWVVMLSRDWERLADSRKRCDRSPLGCGAFGGSTLPLDRDLLAREAGLGSPTENALDTVGDRDFIVEFVAAAALCMTHLSRMAEDLIIWSSVEFGFVRLPDAFASGSSMMPQKKNPDVPELIRGKSALVVGDLTAILTLVKGVPTSYVRDLQEDKTPLFHSASTLDGCLRILAAMLGSIEFDADRAAGAISSFAGATDLAEFLVGQGVPFREAHASVGAAVTQCMKSGRSLSDVTISELNLPASGALITHLPDISPRAAVERKATAGSTNPAEVQRQLEFFTRQVEERRT